MHRPWRAWKALHFATMFKGREHREVTFKKKKKNRLPLPSAEEWGTCTEMGSLCKKRTEEKGKSVWMLFSKAQINLRATHHSQCKLKALVAAETILFSFFYFKLHEQSLRMQCIPFPCVKEGKAIRPEWQIFLYYRWEDFKQRMKKRTLVDVIGAHQKCSLTESTNTALKYPFPFFTEFSHHFLYQSPTIQQ